MPLLYGEGSRAFVRLQEEIMKISTDETLFAWRTDTKISILQGLLAMSPDHFADSGTIVERIYSPRLEPFMVTNNGLRMEIMLPEASRIREADEARNILQEKGFENIKLYPSFCLDLQSRIPHN